MMHKHTAQGLASLGRGPDTELVHMTKGEVHGLQKLAMSQGGSLTINPHTGLPEAGFLSSILPMVIGAGLVAATGGTALALTPMMAAGITGAGYTMATGSLKKGLMAGLGAYGGAGLASAVAGAGTTALAEGAQTTVGSAGLGGAALPAVPNAGAGLAATAEPVALTNAAIPNVAAVQAPAMTTAAAPTGYGYPEGFGVAPAASAAPVNAVPAIPQVTPSNINPTDLRLAQGAQLAPTTSLPPASTSDIYSAGLKSVAANPLDFAKANAYPLMGAGASVLSGMTPDGVNAPAQSPGMIRPYTFSRTQNEQPDALGSLYRPGQSTRERQYFTDKFTAGTPYAAPGPEYKTMAAGGIAQGMRPAPMNAQMSSFAAASDKMGTQQGLRETIQAAKTGDRAALSALQNAGYDLNKLNTFADGGPIAQMPINTGYSPSDRYVGDPSSNPTNFAGGGGISNLGGYSDGGQLLRGPGDGVSDSIPAMIGQKQHARLADGEFVVPARIVSELGNGSTEAGSRQLYAMMDRIQKARKKSIGKNKVATNSRAAKLLPA